MELRMNPMMGLLVATGVIAAGLLPGGNAFGDEGEAKFNPGHYVAVGPSTGMAEIRHLGEPAVRGVNKRYRWRALEPEKGVYDFSEIEEDLRLLAEKDKQLVVFVIDRSFSEYRAMPRYLAEYEVPGEWGFCPVRWHPVVVERLVALGRALGERFDAHPDFEGVAVQETALDMPEESRAAHAYTPEKYRDALIAMLTGVQQSMPRSHVFWYCNFMADDDGHLRQVADAIEAHGIFMGGPDILPFRRWLSRMSYPMYEDYRDRLTLFCSAQDDSYKHHKDDVRAGQRAPVHEEGYLTMEEIFLFARDTLHVKYLFWNYKYGGEDKGERTYDDAIEVIRKYPTFNTSTGPHGTKP